VEKYIQFRHRIEQALWDEEIGKWKVHVRSGDRVFVDECDVFINTGSVLK
jgi:cation diffusion facilitator CzcD-associated flavoprotein CzcO